MCLGDLKLIKYNFKINYNENFNLPKIRGLQIVLSIGKLYRRQDAIGTPFCVTVDFESLEDNTVTIRDRDTLEQERVPIDKLESIVNERVSMSQLFM